MIHYYQNNIARPNKEFGCYRNHSSLYRASEREVRSFLCATIVWHNMYWENVKLLYFVNFPAHFLSKTENFIGISILWPATVHTSKHISERVSKTQQIIWRLTRVVGRLGRGGPEQVHNRLLVGRRRGRQERVVRRRVCGGLHLVLTRNGWITLW